MRYGQRYYHTSSTPSLAQRLIWSYVPRYSTTAEIIEAMAGFIASAAIFLAMVLLLSLASPYVWARIVNWFLTL